MTVNEWLGEDNKLGQDIWNGKYKYEDETFDEWLDRVSGGDEELRQLIVDKKFLFGGRILANRGLQYKGKKITFSNCYVMTPPEDNIESIFDCAGKLARTFSYGGGCGVDISKLAPRGARVNNSAKETTGSVSFMDLYSLVTDLIGQNGRRGALMLSLDCTHPDLEEFIEIKSDLDKVTKANISVKITKEFMDAVKKNEEFKLSFVREETGEEVSKVVNAKEVFEKLAKMNWEMAEPGVLFWDRIKEWNLLSECKEFEYAGVNPCAEEPLPPGGSCLLGSINLSEFVIDPFTEDSYFDFIGFRCAIRTSVKALNDVLDEGLSLHPLQEQRESVRDWRQIGLGIMGLADMLIKMGIRYGSKKSLDICEEIAFEMIDTAIERSATLAGKKGTFPKYNENSISQSEFYRNNTIDYTKCTVNKYGLLNSQLLTIAPTGSISTMLRISGGIEPIYANYYTRTTKSLHKEGDVEYKVYTHIVDEYMRQHGIEDDKDLPEFFITAQALHYKERINMQSVWQNYIDASISSTVNVPNDFTVEQVADLYMTAYDMGLKGITIFRDGCQRMGILTTGTAIEEVETTPDLAVLKRGDIIQVNDDVVGKKRKLVSGCGSLHCSAFFDPVTGDLLETYLSKGSLGGCNNFMIGLSRMISLVSRAGCDIYTVVDQLNSCGACPSYAVRKATKNDVSKGSCCPIAVGNALLDMYNEVQDELGLGEFEYNPGEEKIEKQDDIKEFVQLHHECPECKEGSLVYEGGCNSCKSCGYSKCG